MTTATALVIYHKGCADGFGAAWAAFLRLGDTADYVACQYTDPVPDVSQYKDVYVVDFSFPREVLDRWWESGINLKVIDHHKTAKEDLMDAPYALFDMDHSGAVMTYEYFFPGEPVPMLLRYIEDRDLWRHQMPDTDPVVSWIFSIPYEFCQYSNAHEKLSDPNNYEHIVEIGNVLLAEKRRYVKSQIPRARRTKFFDYDDVPVINTSSHCISEVLAELARNSSVGFAVSWFQREDGKFVYSLRSISSVDISGLAKQMGGGGHPQASGAVADRLFHSL